MSSSPGRQPSQQVHAEDDLLPSLQQTSQIHVDLERF